MDDSKNNADEFTYEAARTLYLKEEEESVRPVVKRKGRALEQEISLGNFYVPAGTYPRNKGGQARVYDCYLRGRQILKGEPDYVAKLYTLTQGNRRMIQETRRVNRVVMSLRHPHLPEILKEGDSEDGRFYMVVMRRYDTYDGFLEFESFGRNRRLFQNLFLGEVAGLNDALYKLHEKQIYHSDIKPDNLMQYEDGDGKNHLVLIDFGTGVGGAGREIDTEIGLTAMGVTHGYTAPELLDSKKPRVNKYTDYYSLGLTMAEFVAGRYPKQRDMNETEEDQAYKGRNMHSPHTFYGMLLPKDLPDYLARFFEGTLYSNIVHPEQELYRNRWTGEEVRKWLSLVRAGEYEKAAGLTTGLTKEGEPAGKARERLTEGIHVKYDSEEKPILIHSTEEMALMFQSHWDETVEKLMGSAKWSRIFGRFGEDVSELFAQARKEMQANEKEQDRIFDQTIMETYLPAQVKEKQLRYQSLCYASRKEFGQHLYAILLQEKIETSGKYRLPGKKDLGNGSRDLFLRMTALFTSGTAERYFKGHQEEWQLENREIVLAEQVRKSAEQGDKTVFVENLYRLSFRLQRQAYLQVDGKIYAGNKKFLAYLRTVYNKDVNAAIKIQQQCYTPQKKLKIDYYAFLQEDADVVKRPKVSERETLT